MTAAHCLSARNGTVILALLLCGAGVASGDCPPCGDRQCLNDPLFSSLRNAKKQKLKQAGFSA